MGYYPSGPLMVECPGGTGDCCLLLLGYCRPILEVQPLPGLPPLVPLLGSVGVLAA